MISTFLSSIISQTPQGKKPIRKAFDRIYFLNERSNNDELLNRLNDFQKENCYIWNIGKKKVTNKILDGFNLAEHIFDDYSIPPINDILLLIKNILSWYKEDEHNLVFILYGKYQKRSVILVSYIYYLFN